MLGNTAPLHDIFPNEVIRMFLKHLSNKQLLGVMRTALIWRYLGRGLLKRFITKEYPYLATDQILNPLSDAECITLIEKQQAIYANLLKGYGLPSENVQRAVLETLYHLSKEDKENKIFTQAQSEFLAAFAVASGIIDNDLNAPSDQAFRLMACIGNVGKLKQWLVPAPPTEAAIQLPAISAEVKGSALEVAAESGHLLCLTYLLEQCREEIFAIDKGRALEAAATSGHLPCLTYLLEQQCREEIFAQYKEPAFQRAARNGHLPCLIHLLEQCREEISVEHKRWALYLATWDNHQTCIQFLEKHLNPTPFFTNMQVGTGEEKSSSKRKRVQDNENELPPSKKIKDKKTNKNQQSGWSCSVM